MNDEEYREALMRKHVQEKREERERYVRRQKLLIGTISGIVLVVALVCFIKIRGPKIAAAVKTYAAEKAAARAEKKAEKERIRLEEERKKLEAAETEGKEASGSNAVSLSETSSDSKNNADTSTAAKEEEKTEPVDQDFSILMSFAGDCEMANDEYESTDYGIRYYEEVCDNSYFFGEVIDYFANDDYTVVNSENVLSDLDLWPIDKGEGVAFWFKAPAWVANIYAQSSIEAVTINNNHTYDYGQEGLDETRAALEAAGVDWGYDDTILYYEKEGFKISVICVSFYYPEGSGYVYDLLETAKETSDFQVIYFHGGEEAVEWVEDWKQEVCRSFVDNGADLVLGAHPHVLQKRERYNGVNIVYSLGNFCFGGNSHPATNRTIIYQLELKLTKHPDGSYSMRDTVETMIPCYVYTGDTNNYQPAPIEDEDGKNEVLQFMEGNAESLR